MKITKQMVLWVILVIILGAIGSGLWSYAFDPLLSYSSDITLKAITFGFKSLEDQIFLEIAKGFHERPSLLLLSFTFGLFLGLLIVMLLALLLSPQKYIPDVLTNRTFISGLLLLFILVMLLFIMFRTFYINDQITYYNQLYDIVAPFTDEEERLLITADFAQIENKENYIKIISHLKDIARDNNQTFREYRLSY